MASLFEGLDTPKFIGPFEQMQMANVEAQAVGRNFMAGMQLAAESKARQAQLSLSLKKFALDQQSQELNNKQTQAEIDDAAELNKWKAANDTGQQYEPKLGTLKGQSTFQAMQLQTVQGKAKAALLQQYQDAIEFEPKVYSEFDGLRPLSKEWTDKLDVITEQQRERRKVELQQAETFKEQLRVEAEQKKQEAIAGRTIKIRDAAGQEVDAIPIHDPVTGETIGYGVRNAQGGMTQMRNINAGLSQEEKARLSHLYRRMETVQRKQDKLSPTGTGFMGTGIGAKANKEYINAQKEVDDLQKQIDALESKQESFGESTEPPAGNPAGPDRLNLFR